MGNLFTSVKSLTYPTRKRKHSSTVDSDDSSPIKKRIRSTYAHVYRELFCKGEGSDIVVSALGYEWLLHRIYIKQSPFFAAMLDGGWKESDCKKIDLELSDTNITKPALDVIFGSFYFDCVSISDQTVLSILAAATWFHLDDIRLSCSDFLKRKICLDTIIEYHSIAGKYGLPELSQACIDWLAQKLLVLADSPALFSLLQNIPISLMTEVVCHPKLVVVQMEQDVFICLLKWMYLQQHPDKEYCQASQLLQEAYEYYTNVKPNFLSSTEGSIYATAFRGVRWEHVVTIYKATRRMLQDRIVPEAWLMKAFQRQWLQNISIHETQCTIGNSNGSTVASRPALVNGLGFPSSADNQCQLDMPGPRSGLSEGLFWKYSERYGRRMSSGDTTCSWRWMGFHFGLDFLLKYRRRTFYIIRLTDVSSSEGSVCRTREHRIMICMTVLSCSDSTSQDGLDSASSDGTSVDSLPESVDAEHGSSSNMSKCSSGVKTLHLTENSLFELLRLPESFAFPITISANILRYDPLILPDDVQGPLCDSAFPQALLLEID